MPLIKKTLYFDDLKFGYDSSLIREIQKKGKQVIILSVTLKMKRVSSADLEKAKYIAKTWQQRKLSQPKISCGSVFQSLTPEQIKEKGFPTTSIGYITDKVLNLKGYQVGGAIISQENANFIPNVGSATSSDVLSIMRKIKTSIKEKTGLSVIPEIDYLGFEKSEVIDIWER
jgi:UDP-N-acetylmuramate dehydrogenase